ncbi:hypothetical protein GCM10007977_019610 [Dactylosporangium sucinum]|uniref:Uncharacterized protein n=1 Tax=Dactylosporangium sucinum TaxID=1424081 RepID=A0A917WP22_9ACTN|nr:hypothetical protein GCM10007977_019610 [Dactylosporangium sucinum]
MIKVGSARCEGFPGGAKLAQVLVPPGQEDLGVRLFLVDVERRPVGAQYVRRRARFEPLDLWSRPRHSGPGAVTPGCYASTRSASWVKDESTRAMTSDDAASRGTPVRVLSASARGRLDAHESAPTGFPW